jgi:hypothetical protein
MDLVQTDSVWSLDFRQKVSDLFVQNVGGEIGLRLLQCRQPHTGYVGECPDCGQTTKFLPESCGLRICPDCAAARSTELACEILPSITRLSGSLPRPWYQMRHIVLTTVISAYDDVDHVRRRMRDLRPAIRKMFQKMFPKDKYLGGLIGAEFGPNGRRLHFHVLIACRWINKQDLTDAWVKTSGGDGVVNWIAIVDDVTRGVNEITKYVTKPHEVDEQTEDAAELVLRLYQIVNGTRLISTFGTFYNMPREKHEPDCRCEVCGAELVWIPYGYWKAGQESAPLEFKSADKLPPESSAQPPPLLPGFRELFKPKPKNAIML